MKVVTRTRTVSESTPVWDITYHLARDVYPLVLEHVSRTKSVKCSEIVKLSQKIRDVTPVAFNPLLSSHRPPSLMSGYLCSQYQFHSRHLRTLSRSQH